MKSQKGKKSQKLLTENLHERPPIQNISFSLNLKGYYQHRALFPGGEQFLWFLKTDLLRIDIILFFGNSNKRIFF